MANQPREPLHVLIYGDSGSKKSTFAATFPKPLLVFFFEALGKDAPYLRAGAAKSGRQGGLYPQQDVYDEKGEMIIRLEYYRDLDPTKPTAYSYFQERFFSLQQHVYGIRVLPTEPQWQTLVFDSVTDLELAIRKNSQYKLNPTAKDPRQWFNESTNQLEETLMMSVGSLPINIITICHVDEDKDELQGTMVRNPAFPGRLRKRSSAAYAEFYNASVRRGEKGESVWFLRTQNDGFYNANSQILAPHGCEPTYEALWKGIEK